MGSAPHADVNISATITDVFRSEALAFGFQKGQCVDIHGIIDVFVVWAISSEIFSFLRHLISGVEIKKKKAKLATIRHDDQTDRPTSHPIPSHPNPSPSWYISFPFFFTVSSRADNLRAVSVNHGVVMKHAMNADEDENDESGIENREENIAEEYKENEKRDSHSDFGPFTDDETVRDGDIVLVPDEECI